MCESRRDSVLQPRVGVFQQPWGTAEPGDPTPTGLRQRRGKQTFKNRHNPFQGCDLISFSQGWLKNANPGLEDEIPSGFIPRPRIHQLDFAGRLQSFRPPPKILEPEGLPKLAHRSSKRRTFHPKIWNLEPGRAWNLLKSSGGFGHVS